MTLYAPRGASGGASPSEKHLEEVWSAAGRMWEALVIEGRCSACVTGQGSTSEGGVRIRVSRTARLRSPTLKTMFAQDTKKKGAHTKNTTITHQLLWQGAG